MMLIAIFVLEFFEQAVERPEFGKMRVFLVFISTKTYLSSVGLNVNVNHFEKMYFTYCFRIFFVLIPISSMEKLNLCPSYRSLAEISSKDSLLVKIDEIRKFFE